MSPHEADLLDSLLLPREGPCVSIHLALTPWEQDVRQARIRWKSLVRRAAALLAEQGTPPDAAEALLEPAASFDLLGAVEGRRAEGLAAWVAPGFFRAEPLDRPPEESVVVGSRFRLKPLLSARARVGRFHVLAFSPHRVRLIVVSARSATEIEVPDMPRSLDEPAAPGRRERAVALESGGAARAHRALVTNGEAHGGDARREALARFCRRIDAAVARVLRADRTPLVLACVAEIRSTYEKVSTYLQLLPEFVPGNPDLLHTDELAERGRELMESRCARTEGEAMARFRALDGTGRTTTSIEEVVPAAFGGRVETLFLSAEVDQEAFDLAAVESLRHGASVFVLPRVRLPSAPVAAILRA